MKKLSLYWIFAGVFFTAPSLGLVFGSSFLPGGHHGKVGAPVYQALESNFRVPVIVMLFPAEADARERERLMHEVEAAQDAVLERLSPDAFELVRRFRAIPALAGRVTCEGISTLASLPEVRRVDLEDEVRLQLTEAVPLTNSDDMHAMGFTGEGVTAAIIDTGLDTDHPDLADDLVDEACFCSLGGGCCPGGGTTQFGAGAAEAGPGHGTSVSGIITSGGLVAPSGVAPDAGIVMIRVFSNAGGTTQNDILAGLDWVLTDRPDVDLINMSLSSGAGFDDECDNRNANTMAYASVINGLRANGVITFSGSGNNASALMSLPACVANVIAVGCSYDANVGSRNWPSAGCSDPVTAPDMATCFANASVATDAFAPGALITTSGLNGGTFTGAGGSFASPHALGCAANLLEAYPGATPDQIETALETSGVQVDHPWSGLSFPRVDCLAAFNSLNVANPPNTIPALYAVKDPAAADVVLIWDDPPTDPQHDAADNYGIFRSVTVPDSGYLRILDHQDTAATREQAADTGAIDPSPPGSSLHFYRVSAFNAGGDSGDIPPS